LNAGYWADAAYVAEYVLTPDELAAYVERQWPVPEDPGGLRESDARFDHQGELWPENTLVRIRWLTGRRLARLKRWDEATDFFPEKWKTRLEEFVRALQRGRAPDALLANRAEDLWTAAQIARQNGMELFGTEVEPDWTLFDGQYDWGHVSDMRKGAVTEGPPSTGPERAGQGSHRFPTATLTASSTDEQRRIRDHTPAPDERFHYRYFAADLAWEAAHLMPDNADETAHVLWTAGTWLKVRDPQAADRFYKALVRRCGQTALGQRADFLRWFPGNLSHPSAAEFERER
jgi:hypothetical protein